MSEFNSEDVSRASCVIMDALKPFPLWVQVSLLEGVSAVVKMLPDDGLRPDDTPTADEIDSSTGNGDTGPL